MTRHFRKYAGAHEVAEAASSALILKLNELLEEQNQVHISLTGGTVGILTLAKLGDSSARESVDWQRVHLWWGDERFVASDSSDRNANQAKDVFISRIEIPSENIHEFGAADAGQTLDEALIEFEAELNKYTDNDESQLQFDVTLLGIGPDGHVASLFPGKPIPASGSRVISESDSPKPPPQRLSFTYEAINASAEVWFLVSGADKAEAVSVAFSDDPYQLPVGRINGRLRTIWFADEAAASKIDAEQLAE